jgi:hypothetical protein
MDTLYAFKCRYFRSTRRTVTHIWNTIVKLFLKLPALLVEVTLNCNYPRQNLVCFATLQRVKTLYMSSE